MIRSWYSNNRIQIISIAAVAFCIAAGWFLYASYGREVVGEIYGGRGGLPLEYYYGQADNLLIRIGITFAAFGVAGIACYSLLRGRYRFVLCIALAIMLFGAVAHYRAGYSVEDSSGHALGSDDAYILYRYARNFASGHGLVFNPGERVEGYSALLYVLLLAAGYPIVGDEGMYPLAFVLNLVFVSAAFLIFYKHIRVKYGDERAALAAAMFALCPTIWSWAASGMGTMMVLLVQVAIWAAAERIVDEGRAKNILLLCLLSAVSVLSRVDGFIFPGIAAACLLLKGRRRAAIYCAATLALALSAYVLWRYNYYGYIFANTYYAKVSGPPLARFVYAMRLLSSLVFERGLFVYLVLFLFALVWPAVDAIRGRGGFLKGVEPAAMFAVPWLAYWIYIGGDHFDDRFLLIIFPIGISAVMNFTNRILDKRVLLFLVAIVLLMQLRPLCPFSPDKRFDYSLNRYDRWITLGRFLKENYPGRTLAVDAAGKIPYFSGMTSIDMLGLNDEHIGHTETDFFAPGHNKKDPDYVLARNPDLIACWIGPDMNLYWGLTREKYERAGYAPMHLVYSGKFPPGDSVIGVRGLSEKEMSRLISHGYNYAVVGKR